ncbi:reverse transcriptase domain-containing protein [Tanacetum coccineum]
MLERLSGNEYYYFLDGFFGHFQIPLAPKDQEKTTFTYPYGTFAYKRMPFGLCNAPTTFQRCMTAIFHDMCKDFMEVFMDEFSVLGNSFGFCLSNLSKMLTRCEETNLVLNWEKCHFMVKEGIVLGHKISKEGIEVDKAKVDVIASLPYLTNFKGIQSFLGHVGFYRRFIKDFSKIAHPMTPLLMKDAKFDFLDECIKSFDILRDKLITALVIIAPNWDIDFELMCDISDYAVGDVLGQRIEKKFCPIYYASKTMNNAQEHYTATEKELLVGPTGGHYGADITAPKIFESRFYWPTIFKDVEKHVQGCDACQRAGILSFRNQMPLTDILVNEVFDIWGIDFMDHFPPQEITNTFLKYGVTHRLATPYHPQRNGQAENTNRAIKRILERTVNMNRKEWADKLNDALWAFGTTYKIPISSTPFMIVYGKACHLPIEIEHKAYWSLKNINLVLDVAGKHRFLQLNQLNEFWTEAYEHSRAYKERTKRWHDSKIMDKEF